MYYSRCNRFDNGNNFLLFFKIFIYLILKIIKKGIIALKSGPSTGKTVTITTIYEFLKKNFELFKNLKILEKNSSNGYFDKIPINEKYKDVDVLMFEFKKMCSTNKNIGKGLKDLKNFFLI